MTKERFFVICKTYSLCGSSRIQKGGMGVEDANFKELFQRIVDRYELAPDVAAELLQRILAILKNTEDEALQSDSKYEILIEHLEREEML